MTLPGLRSLEQRLTGLLNKLKASRRAAAPVVEAEYLRLIYRNLATLSPISLAMVIFLTVQVDADSAPAVHRWSAWYAVYLCFRWLASLLYPRSRALSPQELHRWSALSVLLQGCNGLLLGGLGLFVVPSLDLYEQMIATMVVLIFVGATAFNLSGRLLDTLIFAPPIYLSFAWAVSLQNHEFANGVSVLILALFVLHLVYGNNHRRSIVQGLEVARRSADLARELQFKNIEFQEVASARSRLLATVSHDLRQPAHAIGLLSERAMVETSFVAVKDTLRDLHELSQSLSASLITLMDLTRLDAGLVQPRIGAVSLAQVLLRVDAEFSASARAKGLDLAVAPTDCWVQSDPVLLHGVLTNLVSNAIKYTRQGGVKVRVMRQGRAVRIEVSDTGVGIRADKLNLIFKEFVRLDTSDAGTEGLGLGLSIVSRYANLLSHQLSVQSRPGEGSTFSVTLEQAEPSPQALEQAAASAQPPAEGCLRGLHVLVIDNVELLLMSMSKTLLSWECHVQSARNLAEALHCSAQQWPDLVVTDYHLGDREPDGLELINVLRLQAQRCGRPHLPALLMTGDVSARLEALASEVGVQILHKPIRPQVLRANLVALLDLERV